MIINPNHQHLNESTEDLDGTELATAAAAALSGQRTSVDSPPAARGPDPPRNPRPPTDMRCPLPPFPPSLSVCMSDPRARVRVGPSPSTTTCCPSGGER